MFFRERSTQAEYFDAPERSAAERLAAFQELDRVNRLFRFEHPFTSRLPAWLGQERCARLNILDVGAGTGLLGRLLTQWAADRGWHWRITSLDQSPVGPSAGGAGEFVSGSALDLPFADQSFDLVVASQMTHHLDDAEVVQHWREAWRVSRDAIFICDLHRNAAFYAMLWLTLRLLGTEARLRHDGLLSIERGFRRREWKALAARAEIPGAKVWLYYGTRIGLQARKRPH